MSEIFEHTEGGYESAEREEKCEQRMILRKLKTNRFYFITLLLQRDNAFIAR